MNGRFRRKFDIRKIYIITFTLFIFSIIVALKFGAVEISVCDIKDIITSGSLNSKHMIFYNIRLPRVLLGAVIGFGLATVGAVMQSIFQNPLVDSYTLGMSSGASLGAVVAIVTGISSSVPGISTLSIFAFLGSVGTLALVYLLSSTKGKVNTTSLLLSGIVVSYFISAIISVTMMLNHDKIENIVFWNMGSLTGANWNKVFIASLVILPGVMILYYYWRELNMMSFGDDMAQHLGVNIVKTKGILLTVSSLIVGTIVSISGTIGFVGLIAPHIARYFVGAENKKLLILTSMLGSIILMLADTVGRVIISPAEVPVGIMTSVIAGPLFIYLLRKNRRK